MGVCGCGSENSVVAFRSLTLPLSRPPHRLLRHWRRALLILLCPVLVTAAIVWSNWLTFDSARWPGQRLSVSDSIEVGDARAAPPPPTAAWRATPLPDNWKVTRPGAHGSVWYRIDIDPRGIAEAAILIPRLAAGGQVRLNGSLLWEARSGSPAVTHSWNAPLLLLLPEGLLHPGGNQLLIEVAGPARLRAGLSQIQLGSHAALRPIYRWRAFWQNDGALLSCAVSAIAGLLLMLTWLRNRRNSMYLYFGLATLVWALRNSNLFIDELPISLDSWVLLVHAGHIWFNSLFALFVLRYTRTAWPRLEAAIWLYAIANSMLMLSGALATIETMLSWMIVPAIGVYLLLIGLLLRRSWRSGEIDPALIAATTLTFLVLSLRDALLLSSRLPYDAYYISHYTGVLMLVAIAWTLVSQLARAAGEIERANVTLEARVAQRTRELELANASKTRFLAAASHDLRQPVVTIGLLLGLLRESVTAPAVRAMVDRIHDATAAMEALLKGLLDLSRLDSGTIEPRLRTVALAPAFQAIELHHQPAAAEKNLRLRFHPTALAVSTDPLLLDQILRNLVDNAIRHTTSGGVLVGARRRGGSVLLQVWDSGPGIAAESQGVVFEEFVQLDNRARDGARGLGLGLAIVQRSARMLGRAVALRSVPGRGSCFSIELPRAASNPPDDARPAPQAQPLAGIAVWMIEDNASVRDALAARLHRWGADVTALSDRAAVARELAGARPAPDLIVSDQRLPDGTGIDCIALIRHLTGHPIAALIVTGDTAPGDLALLRTSGLPTLHKPFAAAALLAALQDALRTRDSMAAAGT